MKRTFPLFAAFALAAGLAVPAGFAQSTPPAKSSESATCRSTKNLEDLIKALDEAVSGPADKDRTCLRQVLYPNARLSPVTKTREGGFGPHVLSVDEWIQAVAKRGKVGLYEKQIKVKSDTYGHIAQLWSTYEIRGTPEGKAELRGINSIQASYDGTRWRVLDILWEAETPSEKIPEKYLP
jgi:hypothetical protein